MPIGLWKHTICYAEEVKPELENREEKRPVGERQRPEDVGWPEDVVHSPPPKFKIPNSHFEQ
jgi:hypothetical protein